MRHRYVIVVGLVLLSVSVVSAQTLTPMWEGIVPVVVRTPGAAGSQWSTALYVAQASGDEVAGIDLLVHNPSGDDWTVSLTLPAVGGAAQVDDLLTFVDVTIPDGKYILSWTATAPVVFSTRTFTTEASGSYGQGVGALEPGTGFGLDGTVLFPAPMDFGPHRVNVGVANAGAETQTFVIEALDRSGEVVTTWTKAVSAGAIVQLRTNDGFDAVGSVAVRCSEGCDGTAFAYLSVVVNDSNDAYYQYAAAQDGETTHPPVSTVRDDKGVFYITGGSLADVFEAMGYAVAVDRLWQAEVFRRQARGRMAEIFGPGYLEADTFIRTVGYSDTELGLAYVNLDVESKTVIESYVAGFNRRIAEVKADSSLLPYEFKTVGSGGNALLPEDWSVADVLAWMALTQRFFDPEGLELDGPYTGQLDNAALLQALTVGFAEEAAPMFADLRWLDDPGSQTMIPGEGGSPKQSPLPGVTATDMPDLRAAALRVRQRAERLRQALIRIGARVKMGSYAWVVDGSKTASGDPILYSGPEMGFMVPSVVLEASIRGGGLDVSGMTIAGLPGIILGRTPHHAWSMQVGHAHTADFYVESPESITLDRIETINVAGQDPVTVPVYKSLRGPVIEPFLYDPDNPPAAIITWKYAHRDLELGIVDYALKVARAESVSDFSQAVEAVGVSQHFCYADREGAIAYWMSGRDPVRPAEVDVRFPLPGDGSAEWDAGVLKPRSHDSNPDQGYYGGWNNKSRAGYENAPNNLNYAFGPGQRAHVIEQYLSESSDLTFDDVRDLALDIATTESYDGGGVAWTFVAEAFMEAVATDPTTPRTEALALLDDWDGHFVAGGQGAWASGTVRAEAWVLQDSWIDEVIRLTFADEFSEAGLRYSDQHQHILFNVLLHQLAGEEASVVNRYDWFRDRSGAGLPTTADGIILQALDTTINDLGQRPWTSSRGVITYTHDFLGDIGTTPYSRRSTYAQCVEIGADGPTRIESFFPLGQSGTILMTDTGGLAFDQNFFSLKEIYDAFDHRPFPLFD